jgi:outer membrane protein insertion porin family
MTPATGAERAGVLFRLGRIGFGDSSFIDTTAEVTAQTRVLSEDDIARDD